MNLWTLELARLWRTGRLISLLAVYAILGLGLPILTYELPTLLKHTSSGVRVIAPPPTATSSLAGFASNSAQLGTLVLIIVAAATIAIDARPALAAFYRSRTRRPSRLFFRRLAALGLATAVSLATGTVCCWYETTVLIGRLNAGALAGGYTIELLWISFSLALVTAWSSVTASVAGIAGSTIATLLALSFAGTIRPVGRWLPTQLATGLVSLSGPHPTGFAWPAIAVTAAVSLTLISVACRRLSHPCD
jgi:ABC-2 type transport system permease protein